MAKYHEIGRFCDKNEEDIDWESAIFHETHAAELGELEAILTMAKLYLGLERDVLVNCVVEVMTFLGHGNMKLYFYILSLKHVKT